MRKPRRHRSRRGLGSIRFEIPPYKRRKFISLMFLGVFLISLALTLRLIDVRLRPSLRTLALAKAQNLAVAAVNKAVIRGTARQIRYQDLVTVKSDSEGRPVLLQPNTGEINQLSARITEDVQDVLAGLGRTKVRLPLGQILGTQILGTWGPEVGVDLLPVGSVASRIIDSFTAAGINQTRHRIYVRVTTEVKVVVPLVAAVAKITTEIPLAEAVIVGQVPGYYLPGLMPPR